MLINYIIIVMYIINRYYYFFCVCLLDHCYCFFRNGYPHQSVSWDIWWYYMISLSFYWSLCVSQFFDVKRKDFWQMFIHHIATIVLMSLSWVCNLPRIGSLVLVVHDCADIFLEVSTIVNLKKKSVFN